MVTEGLANPRRTSARPSLRRVEWVILVIILIWAAGLRVWKLDKPLLWVDEAESCINALTILDHGVPVDHYLGIPIYENTLTLATPENPEYEFRDSSYSKKGVAIYHGWLPLYSMAVSLKAFGIQPDHPIDPTREQFTVRHDEREMRRMTIAARAPAVLFGLLFLLVIFKAGRDIYGPDAGWAALLVGAFSNRIVSIAREGRYYSATVLLGTACCWLLWRMCTRKRWKDFIVGGVLYALLFHTHVITFSVAASAGLLCLPFILRGEQRANIFKKLGVFFAIVAAGTLPWILLSGMLGQASGIPRAWKYLSFPQDYFEFALGWPYLLVLLGCGAFALLVTELMRHRLPKRFRQPFFKARGGFYFLTGWVVLGYLMFIFLMPAVSYSFSRMTLPMLGPGLLLVAIIFAALVRLAMQRTSILVTVAVFMIFMGTFAGLRPWKLPRSNRSSVEPRVIDWLRQHQGEFKPHTRFYSTPNRHLMYALFTGLPIQSVAPIRKSYLDSYPGDIVIIEDIVRFQAPNVDEVQNAAARAGQSLTFDQAQDYRFKIVNVAVRQQLAPTVKEVEPPLGKDELPPYLTPLVDERPKRTAEWISTSGMKGWFPAIFRSYPLQIRDWTTRWQIYFYRFVKPEDRMGKNLNYAQRVQNAKAWVTYNGSIIYVSPSPRPADVTTSSQE